MAPEFAPKEDVAGTAVTDGTLSELLTEDYSLKRASVNSQLPCELEEESLGEDPAILTLDEFSLAPPPAVLPLGKPVVDIFAEDALPEASHVWKGIASSGGSNDNRMVIPVVVEKTVTCEALLDSGADRSLIPDSVVHRCQIPYIPVTDCVVNGIGDNNSTRVIGKATVSISIDGLTMVPCEFLILDAAILANTMVLATDFLIINKVTLDLQKRKLTRFLRDGTQWDYYSTDMTALEDTVAVWSAIPCYCLESVHIDPQEAREVLVNWCLPLAAGRSVGVTDTEVTLNMYFEGCTTKKSRHRQALTGIVNGIRGQSKVMINNSGTRKEVIKKGSIIGTISSMIEVEEDIQQVGVVNVEPELMEEEQGDTPDIQLGDHLTDDQKSAVRGIVDNGRQVLSDSGEIGRLVVKPHRIDLTDYTPIYQRPRRFAEVVNQEIEKQCHELELKYIIEPSSSPWSSPIVPVRKKDGSIRLCVDYRMLNMVTKADKFPLPNLNDAVFGLHGMIYFTTFDLVKGYYQLPLDPESRELTAFSTPRAHWQFKRLSFGLKNAPAAFQRELQNILGQFPWKKVIVYIDDVLIMSETFEEHCELVEKVMSTLLTHGVRLNVKKCSWFSESVEFLGHVVSRDGLSKPPAYVEAVRSFPRPTTVTQLREFLGLVQFQRKFIKDCSLIMKPLSSVTGGKKKRKIDWTQEMEDAFVALKAAMCEATTLAFPDYSEGAAPLALFTDASGTGTGACLSQVQKGEIRPIAFGSAAFNPAEKNYSTIERELAAIRWAVKVFRPFLFGVEFVIHTDHQPLQYLYNMQIVDTRLARTLQELQSFDFVIVYTPGKDNLAADALSRLHHDAFSDDALGSVDAQLPDGLVEMEKTPGGGDSLVESLLRASRSTIPQQQLPDSIRELRMALSNELLKSPKVYGLEQNKHQTRVVKAMRHAGRVICAEALSAFSHLYGCIVLVHYGGNIPVLYKSPNCTNGLDGLPRVHLRCLAGVHYNALTETVAYRVPVFLQLRRDAQPKSETNVALSILEEVESAPTPAASTNIEVPYSWCVLHRRTHVSSFLVHCAGGLRCALLDSGAQISCVSEIVWKSTGAVLDTTRPTRVKGVGPNESFTMGTVTLDIVLPNHQTIRGTFVVMPDAALQCCMLLGADVLIQHNLTLDFNQSCCQSHFGDMKFPDKSFLDAGLCGIALAKGLVVADPFVDRFPLGTTITREMIFELQKGDRILSSLYRHVASDLSGRWPKPITKFHRYAGSLSVSGGLVVFRRALGAPVGVVTRQFVVEVALVTHHRMGHPGRQKLLGLMAEQVWHPSLSSVVIDVTRSCDHCQRVKVSSSPLPPITKIRTTAPFELLAVDLIAMPRTKNRNVCCLVAIDHNSKWLRVIPLTSKTATVVTGAMRRHVLPSLPRLPTKILSDNGPEFAAKEFNSLLAEYSIDHVFTTPYKPSSNGIVERVNRTVLELLRNLRVEKSTAWDDEISRVTIFYNSSPHSELGMSPSRYLLEKQHDLTPHLPVPAEDVKYWREGNPSFVSFKQGQKVLKKVVFMGRNVEDKLADRYQGPYKVIRRHSNNVSYVIKHTGTGREIRAHHTQLRRYFDPPTYLTEHPCYLRVVRGDADVVDGEDEESADLPQLPPKPITYGCSWMSSASALEESGSSSDGDSDDDQASVEASGTEEGSNVVVTRDDGPPKDFLDVSTNNPNGDLWKELRGRICRVEREFRRSATTSPSASVESPLREHSRTPTLIIPVGAPLFDADEEPQFWSLDSPTWDPVVMTESGMKMDDAQEVLQSSLREIERNTECLKTEPGETGSGVEVEDSGGVSLRLHVGDEHEDLPSYILDLPVTPPFNDPNHEIEFQNTEVELQIVTGKVEVLKKVKRRLTRHVDRRRSTSDVEPRATRSRGYVEDHPHVQSRTLEYKRRGSATASIVPQSGEEC
jgi:hypothetical protein